MKRVSTAYQQTLTHRR